MSGEHASVGLWEQELADPAGVPVAFVRRAAELGMVRPIDAQVPYTRLTEEQGDEAAAELAASLASVRFEDAGSADLKNVPYSVGVWRAFRS